jgi:rare lipoprotein A
MLIGRALLHSCMGLKLFTTAMLIPPTPQERGVYRSTLIIIFALLATSSADAENGLASYYGGRGHRGKMTCAHRTRAFGSMVTVTYAGRSIRCRVNDRGPFVRGRVIDVSLSAARALGMMQAGIVRVSVE